MGAVRARRRPSEQRRLYQPHAVPARWHALRRPPQPRRGDPTANASGGGAILAPSGRLRRTPQFKVYLATLLLNIIHAKMCWLGNRSGTMATGKQLVLSRRAAKRPRKKRMRPEPRQYTMADLERARDRVAAAERRIDNDPMSNSRRGRVGLTRAELELSVIESQLRSRGLLE